MTVVFIENPPPYRETHALYSKRMPKYLVEFRRFPPSVEGKLSSNPDRHFT
jgi:hypothetical protein